MTAQEWLEELKRLEERATPGPWEAGEVLERGTVVRGHNMIIDCRHTPDKGCFGEHNAAYIVAACNAVPRLVEMIEYLAGRLCDENHGDNDFDGKIQDAFEMTEPKE